MTIPLFELAYVIAVSQGIIHALSTSKQGVACKPVIGGLKHCTLSCKVCSVLAGLLLGTETPVMSPNGEHLSFRFSLSKSVLCRQGLTWCSVLKLLSLQHQGAEVSQLEPG